MPQQRSRALAAIGAGALALSVAAVITPTAVLAAPDHTTARPGGSHQDWAATAYRGRIQVVAGPDEDQRTLDGVVFNDRNKNSRQDRGERGISRVTVSNGRDVVTTDRGGRYRLPAYDNMNVFVTQPAGYQVPVDEANVAQFSYIHLPQGSPALRYGGIAPTGELPDQVNFPMARSLATWSPWQSCIMGGDVQTYNQAEVGYARSGAFADLAARSDYTGCGALFLGDIVGDDLSLYPQTRELSSMLNGPARFLPGNHDLDYDDPTGEHRFDTYRAAFGPDYYSYDVGKLHVVALNSVQYRQGQSYFGGLGEQQLQWLRRDLARVPRHKTVVLASHIPLLNFHDQAQTRHQVKEVKEVHAIVAGRDAVSFAGHSHTTEVMRKGDSTAGWTQTWGVGALPFDHITAGAIAGDWYSGRVTDDGFPTSIQKDGARPGVLTFQSGPRGHTERFNITGEDDSVQMAVGVNSPRYREWFVAHRTNRPAPVFADPTRVSRADLVGQTYLTANVYLGSTGTRVTVSVDGGAARPAQRTQQMRGEAKNTGAEWSDPVAVQEQLVHGGNPAESTMHLWRLALPTDLAVGQHTAKVTSTDRNGRVNTETIEFTVTE
ncbi:calcineurin-like phosphoesterase family protein [Nocardioides sp. 616]|uniref:calcineurin-like phosphoesterase C-terminal domain-containing protein n=1 Tax=Nocardioides sp. 616 TaxID=2268090 RepID=UPI000CE30A6D|nr:calcineurin-like phosphoesterase family protein [Nocardioides sp. 616]